MWLASSATGTIPSLLFPSCDIEMQFRTVCSNGEILSHQMFVKSLMLNMSNCSTMIPWYPSGDVTVSYVHFGLSKNWYMAESQSLHYFRVTGETLAKSMVRNIKRDDQIDTFFLFIKEHIQKWDTQLAIK